MKFDMHIHCGDQPIDPANLLTQMQQCGIYGGVVFSHYPKAYKRDGWDANARIDQVLNVCREYPDRLIPVLWIHPDEPDVLAVVEAAAARGVMGFKIICNNFYVSSCLPLIEKIRDLGKPIIFHSGILWDGGDSSKYNRPLNWECLVDMKGLRFSLGHCSWPWIDECIALYGKFLNAYANGMGAEMFFDITPGTPAIYRKELLTKLYTVGYDVPDNVMFGTDCTASSYSSTWAGNWLNVDGTILRELGADEEIFQKLYWDNVLRFFGLKCREFIHATPSCDNANAWVMGKERPCAAPIRYAKENYNGNFQTLLPVLDDAYALYMKDNCTLSGDEKTDLLANLLRDFRREVENEK